MRLGLVPVHNIRLKLISQLLREEPVRRRHRRVHPAQPLQRQFAQAQAHGITDHERADERRAADRRAEQHAEMPAPVKAQAAGDESPEGH